jgi:hypothetical protein
MPTCLEIITSAYRKAGVVDAAGTLSASDGQVGLELLQEVYLDIVAKGSLGRLNEVNVTADYEAQEMDRIIVTTEDAVDVTLPATYTDEDTGLERTPKDLTVVTVTDLRSDYRTLYIFDAIYGAWTRVDELALDDYAPLSHRFPAGLRAHVAIKRAAEDGLPLSAGIVREAAMMNLALSTRFDGPSSPVAVDFF